MEAVMPIQKFQDILAWQKAHELVLVVYELTKLFPKEELFGLVSQLRRAAVSVPSNIAEGFKRRTKNDSIHFYNIAQGSLEEAKYQLLLAKDLQYIKIENYPSVQNLADETGRLLAGWLRNTK
jgi:four helix bundle protein